MTLIIRRAVATDDDVIWTCLAPVFRAGDSYAVDPDIARDDALAYWHGGVGTVFVAEVLGEVIGTYYLRRNQGGGGAHVCNAGYVVHPEAQGRGAARGMLAHSLEAAKAMGYRAMQYNFVVATNTRAVTTWARAGFRVVGRLPEAFRHPTDGLVDALVMYRPLVD